MKLTLLISLLSFSLYAQNVVNDTLYVYGEDIQLVELSNRKTSQRIELGEVYYGVYMTPLSNLPKGVYTVSIFRDRKRYVSTLEQPVDYDPKNVDCIDGYYYEEVTGNWKRMAYASKAEVVALREKNSIDFLTKNGRKNSLKIYQINNGIKELVYER